MDNTKNIKTQKFFGHQISLLKISCSLMVNKYICMCSYLCVYTTHLNRKGIVSSLYEVQLIWEIIRKILDKEPHVTRQCFKIWKDNSVFKNTKMTNHQPKSWWINLKIW